MQSIEVVSPVGLPVVEQTGAAAQVRDLDGATICEVWNGVFKGDQTFPILRRVLSAKYPKARIIPYTEFPSFWGSYDIEHQKKMAAEIAVMLKQVGCDLVISGNGA